MYIYPHIKYNAHVYIYACMYVCVCVFLYRDRKSKEETMKRGLWEEFEGGRKEGSVVDIVLKFRALKGKV